MSSAMQPVLMMVVMFGIFYFLLIRPQAKRQKAHQNMLSQLSRGDEIITRGGMIGKIQSVSGDVLTVELQDRVRVEVPRTYVDGKWTGVVSKTTVAPPN